MQTLDYTQKDISSAEFIQLINSMRRANKNNWYAFVGLVDGKSVSLKAYDTWLQRYVVDSLHHSSPGDISVKQFVDNLKRPFN